MFKFRIRPGLQKRFIKTLEQKYQKLSPIDHILSRPDSYIGSIQPILQKNFIFKGEQITRKEFPIIPGLYRIIDEILMNAVDNHHREGTGTNLLKIDIKKDVISIWNNGKSIPIELHKEEKIYIPEMVFGHLLTSSNFDDQGTFL
jgi:DNA topoisomerase-2